MIKGNIVGLMQRKKSSILVAKVQKPSRIQSTTFPLKPCPLKSHTFHRDLQKTIEKVVKSNIFIFVTPRTLR